MESKKRLPEVINGDPLATLANCDGFYESPKDDQGRYLGPLVAYAGKDEEGKNEVGGIYFNFAQGEQYPNIREYYAQLIAWKIIRMGHSPDVVIGAPMGGIMLAVDLGRLLGCRTIFAEKKITQLADPVKGTKEQSELIINRHVINKGDRAIVVEDVCNNFSTTQKLRELIESRGGVLAAISCAINRSGQEKWQDVSVVAAVFSPTEQYRQSDSEVASLVESGQVVWEPKQEWSRLKESTK